MYYLFKTLEISVLHPLYAIPVLLLILAICVFQERTARAGLLSAREKASRGLPGKKSDRE
jgi:hypothetical protein